MRAAAAGAATLWTGGGESVPLPELRPAAVPVFAHELAAEVLVSKAARLGRPQSLIGANERLVTDFTEVFLNMYHDRELVARKIARELGAKLLERSREEEPLLFRLQTGVAWPSLVESFGARSGAEQTPETRNSSRLVVEI